MAPSTRLQPRATGSSENCRAAIEATQKAFPAWEPVASRATGYTTRYCILLTAAMLRSEEWQEKAAAAAMRAELAMPQSTLNLILALKSHARKRRNFGYTLSSSRRKPNGNVYVKVVCHPRGTSESRSIDDPG